MERKVKENVRVEEEDVITEVEEEEEDITTKEA